jgi:ABC-2 type transport system ATP-binding protein
MDVITAEGLVKIYKTRKHEVRALDGVDLSVREGTVLGLLGPNGAGKTTTVRILATLLKPDAGRATVAGLDVVSDAQRIRTLIGLSGQYAAVDENLTGRENLWMFGTLYQLPSDVARARATELLDQFDLTDAADRVVKTYSGGMRRRLDLGSALIGRPKLLFMDEPTTGLDPRSRLVLWDLIRDLQKEGTTLLLCTQYLEEADHLCDRIAVIDLGTVIAEGTSEDLKDKIGGEVLELHTATDDLPRAAETLRGLGAGEPSIDEEQRLIRVPVGSEGPRVLLETVRRLDDTDLAIEDIALHKPTLDDVFLSLTGHAAEMALEESEQPEPGPEGKRRKRRER